ncbi:MAG: 6-phosphofructokinase [Candidatus Ozemobacter sibiricus]|jgi:6-phosphofructokinase 1|uniref:ATP-dependent 6-phosphofructokinase n=1 Tax=Candidatus Ozemobacter sibiricus TaxID=2268124 RepID=A0A367ZQI6_9BACT|nr:MAG: 6-phosphofructokinase [Candidatus Ozemobacter sibiricus]
MKKTRTNCIGILTSGGDCPGLNAAIRGVAKAAMAYGMKVIGIHDGFRGLVENRTTILDSLAVSGLLTRGGTVLGTSRDKPHKMPMGGKERDMTQVAAENACRLQLDCLVCLGGGGTQKNAMHLHREAGLRVMTLPKTIDNDVFGTDITFGFDTAMEIATDAIDRLHSTATSHHRIIVLEIMGHNAGWLTLGAGIAGGADVILIPEIPYDLEKVAAHLKERRATGKRFSIIAVAEGAMTIEEAEEQAEAAKKAAKEKERKKSGESDQKKEKAEGKEGGKGKKKDPSREESDEPLPKEGGAVASAGRVRLVQEPKASRIARELQRLTGTEARVTSLGHVVRGGTPSATDRLLCTRLGVRAAELLAEGVYNVMVAVKGDRCEPVPLEQVAGKRRVVPLDHPWIQAARLTGTSLGD